jgi:hypothetical protein
MKCPKCGGKIRRVQIVGGVNSVTYTLDKDGNAKNFVYDADDLSRSILTFDCENEHSFDIGLDDEPSEELKNEIVEFLDDHRNKDLYYLQEDPTKIFRI